MIPEAEIKEIRQLLHQSERPLFLYDDDPDGVTSYLLLKRYCRKGRGIVVKSSPIIDQRYVKKINEINPDQVFILDKPIVEQEFIDATDVPIVWIDHHSPVERENIKYFNPMKNDNKDNRPTSYWCYKVTQQDKWIAACGILGDWQIPDFLEDLIKEYPGLIGHITDPGEALYTTELGKLIRIIGSVLKGSTTEVNRAVSILTRLNNPYEILNETTSRGKYLYKKYLAIQEPYQKLLKKARSKVKKDKLLLFTYPSTKLSLTGELSNELLYLYPDKVILIGREKEDRVIMSIRSQKGKLPKIVKKSMEGLDGYGGGHENACGGSVSKNDFKIFIERFKKEVK
ncbi:MAG: DHH family phosphoesterase [archaeon]